MNWERGFKRITHFFAIVVAIACGIFAGSFPVERFDNAETTISTYTHPFLELYPPQERAAKIEALENKRKKSFWYNLSTAELIGIVVLFGLGGALVGYVCTWAILWYGGLAIFILIGWLVLGFADDKPKDEQKQQVNRAD